MVVWDGLGLLGPGAGEEEEEAVVVLVVPHMAASFLALAMLARSGPLAPLPDLFWIPALSLADDQRDPKASPPLPPDPVLVAEGVGFGAGLPREAAAVVVPVAAELVRAIVAENEAFLAPPMPGKLWFGETVLEKGVLPAWVVEGAALMVDWTEV